MSERLLTTAELDLRGVQRLLLDYISAENNDKGGTKRKNLNPKTWGTEGWAFLDSIVEGYPTRAGRFDQVQMLDFLTSLGYVLPCARCRDNYEAFASKYPPIEYVSSKRRVKAWLKAYKRKNRLKG